MSSDNTHRPYVKAATFTAETTIEEMRQLYSNWSRTYDKDVYMWHIEAYSHTFATHQLSKYLDELGHSKDVSILDFGCGTGVIGQELSKRGYKVIDGLDCCKEMLELANGKGVYRALFQGIMGSEGSKDLGVGPNQYDAAICTGVFAVGHVDGKGFDDLLYVLKPGVWFASQSGILFRMSHVMNIKKN